MVQEPGASINITLPAFCLAKPTQGDGYMIVARDLMLGVEALSILTPDIPPRSCALIAGFALECALKAYLWHMGMMKEILKPQVRHNLKILWEMAFYEGLNSLEMPPPDWVTTLSKGHSPYYFRYQQGEGKTIVHGGMTPNLISMTAELKKLIKKVELAIKN